MIDQIHKEKSQSLSALTRGHRFYSSRIVSYGHTNENSTKFEVFAELLRSGQLNGPIEQN